MNKLRNIFSGQKILAEKYSKINGTLTVVKDVIWGVYIKGGGLTQSGGVAEKVWKTSLNHVRRKMPQLGNVLILGLGGGSIAKLVRGNWTNAKITGVEIDPIMVEFGKKYMNLDDYKVDIKIKDATRFLKDTKEKYDLICVDMYQEDNVPEEFTTKSFVKKLKSLLSNRGVVVFNRLYYGPKRPLAYKFKKLLEEVFNNVEEVYPEANVMYVCS